MLVAGDFNTDVMRANEMNYLKRFTTSAFDLTDDSTPPDQRITHTFHPRDHSTKKEGPADKKQMDDIRATSNLFTSILKAWVVRYKDSAGNVLPFAETYDQRRRQPSDHLPIAIELSTDFLWAYIEHL